MQEKINQNPNKNYLIDLFNENFIKQNEKLLLNRFQETKNNFKKPYLDRSTNYSSKGLYGDGFDLKNTLSTIRFNDTVKIKDQKKFMESKYFFKFIIASLPYLPKDIRNSMK